MMIMCLGLHSLEVHCHSVNYKPLVTLHFLQNEGKLFLFICLLFLLHNDILLCRCVCDLLHVCSLEITLFLIIHYSHVCSLEMILFLIMHYWLKYVGIWSSCLINHLH